MRTDDFDRFYEAHAAGLLAFLEYRTGDLELARDVHADTFERVLTVRRAFDPRRGSEKTWLYAIALNRLRDVQRRRAVETRAVERLTAGAALHGAPEADAIEERDALRRALATLSEREREAIALRYAADLSLSEIATLCDTRVTTIKGRIHGGLRKLREELG